MSKKIQKNVLLIGVFVGLSSVTKAQETKTVTVNSGHVIVYGKYIPPPYTITLKQGPIVDGIPRDTIFINDIAISPPILPPRHAEKRRIRNLVRDTIKSFIEKYGLENARPHLENFLENFSKENPIIAQKWKIKFSESMKNYTVTLYGKNGGNIIVGYPLFREGFILPPNYKLPPKKTERERKISEWKSYAERLREGELITIGPYWPTYEYSKDHILWLSEIKSILLNEKISKNKKKQLLFKIGILRREAEDFFENIDSWRDFKAKGDR